LARLNIDIEAVALGGLDKLGNGIFRRGTVDADQIAD
jgi:hypothetical protein